MRFRVGGDVFTQKTVFVVGAGASYEARLPVGSGLTSIIAEKVNIAFGDWAQVSGDKIIQAAIANFAQSDQQHTAQQYYTAGRTIAAGMIQAISIDNYLHAHADNSALTWVGKVGIAASILEAEQRSLLVESRGRIDLAGVANTWYYTFFQMLTEGVRRSALEDIFENVSFITFNYDRCIEHFLVHALANYFSVSNGTAEELVNQLTIEHPYGQVGKLPWQLANSPTIFGQGLYGPELPDIAAQIRTFTERIDDQALLQKMRGLLSEAEVIVFLGFSFGDMNMDLLATPASNARVMFGTAFGLSDQNIFVTRRQLIDSFGPMARQARLPKLTCNEFLRGYWKPILRAIPVSLGRPICEGWHLGCASGRT